MNASHQNEVQALRLEISRCQEEIEWLASAPVPIAELKARTGEQVRRLAAKFEAQRHLRSLANPGAGFAEFAGIFDLSARVFVGGAAVQTATITDAGPLLAWALGDALVKRLDKEADGLDYVAGPPMAERPAMVATLKAELRTLEEREEALIVAAEERGTHIGRRADADPAVVLGYDPAGELAEPRTAPRRLRGPTVVSS